MPASDDRSVGSFAWEVRLDGSVSAKMACRRIPIDRLHAREAIGDGELEVLFSDPDRIAEAMGHVFLRLMEKEITGDWELPLDEEAADTLGFTTFIRYVCGGMTL